MYLLPHDLEETNSYNSTNRSVKLVAYWIHRHHRTSHFREILRETWRVILTCHPFLWKLLTLMKLILGHKTKTSGADCQFYRKVVLWVTCHVLLEVFLQFSTLVLAASQHTLMWNRRKTIKSSPGPPCAKQISSACPFSVNLGQN